MQCDTAVNGKITFEKLKISTSLPDLIFLNLNMPIMNGFNFLIQIKKENMFNKIPLGIFTTSNNPHDIERTKELGAQFFLTKPNDFKVLRSKLQHILTLDFLNNTYISIK